MSQEQTTAGVAIPASGTELVAYIGLVQEAESKSYYHHFSVSITVPTEPLQLAVAIMRDFMKFDTAVIGQTVRIGTNEVGLSPTRYNASRRLELAIAEATALIAESVSAPVPESKRPVQVEVLQSADDGHWYRGDERQCGGIRYVFASGVGGGIGFGRPHDGWRRMFQWASHEEVGAIIAGIMSARLGQNCRTQQEDRRRFFPVEVAGSVDLMAAFDAGNIAEALWKAGQVRLYGKIAELPWQGRDSLFEDAFNDERDVVMSRLVAGALLAVQYTGWYEGFGSIDGEAVSPAVVSRLLQSAMLESVPEDRQRSDARRFQLKASVKSTPRLLTPRTFTVSFHAFEEHCAHRRHFQEIECLHSKGHSDRCSAATCPLVDPVYLAEKPVHICDDPHFNFYGEDWDTPVVAAHRNTERSYAFRAAGEARLRAILNRAAHAFMLNEGSYLPGRGELPAVREAVTLGYLEVVEESTLGPIVRLAQSHADVLRARMRQVQTAEAHPAQ